jgi:hypothetical protein
MWVAVPAVAADTWLAPGAMWCDRPKSDTWGLKGLGGKGGGAA